MKYGVISHVLLNNNKTWVSMESIVKQTTMHTTITWNIYEKNSVTLHARNMQQYNT